MSFHTFQKAPATFTPWGEVAERGRVSYTSVFRSQSTGTSFTYMSHKSLQALEKYSVRLHAFYKRLVFT